MFLHTVARCSTSTSELQRTYKKHAKHTEKERKKLEIERQRDGETERENEGDRGEEKRNFDLIGSYSMLH